ncbi:unnamed protein product [Lasius platythorax]|uniref:Uncharacterized protein n=1 Tax=Lasius platythorax TaxID=488582 RepID=A0AAV2MYS5_9HYME
MGAKTYGERVCLRVKKSLTFVKSRVHRAKCIIEKMEPEVEIITIDSSDDEMEVIVQDDEMDVVLNAEEEAGSDNEIEPAYDSDYSSECDAIDFDTHIQNIDTADIISMDGDTKMCAIHIYYQPWGGVKLCARCFLRRRDLNVEIDVVRTHRTARLDLLLRQWCTECNGVLEQLFVRNMCPVCNSCNYSYILKY